MAGAGRRAHPRRFRLALPGAARVPEVHRSPEPPEAAALLARGAGNARDHRLPAAVHSRRYRGDTRRRGVHNIIRALEARGWIDVVGHSEVPGRPELFATTRTFLDDLSLGSLEELPPLDEIAKALGEARRSRGRNLAPSRQRRDGRSHAVYRRVDRVARTSSDTILRGKRARSSKRCSRVPASAPAARWKHSSRQDACR